jgi:hypothetical protein
MSKTPSSKMMGSGYPKTHTFFSDLENSEQHRESLEVFRSSDQGFEQSQADLIRQLNMRSKRKVKLDISCENIKENELLSRRKSRKKPMKNTNLVREMLGSGKEKIKKKQGKRPQRQSKKKRRIQSMKETKDILSRNDLKYPLTNEWTEYSSKRYSRNHSGILKKKFGNSSKNHKKKTRGVKSKTQFFSQNRKSKGTSSNFLRLSPKQNRTTNITKTSLYSDVASSRNIWSRTHNLTKNIQFELLKNKTGKKKKKKQDYLTLRTSAKNRKPFDVRYSITSKNKISEQDLLLNLERRNFNSVDWMAEQVPKLEKYSDLELFFKKRAKKNMKVAHLMNMDKENMRLGFKKQKPRVKEKGRPLEVDLYSGKLNKPMTPKNIRKKSSDKAGKQKKSGSREKEATRTSMGQDTSASIRNETKKKAKKKVYSSLTEILKKESLNERISLKGIDSEYFDNIYQKLSTKLHTKKRDTNKKDAVLGSNKTKTNKSNINLKKLFFKFSIIL